MVSEQVRGVKQKGERMNREQAINYLRSSGYSEKQIDAITDAFENPYLKAFEDIRAEFIRWIEMDGGSDEYNSGLRRGLNIVDKYDPSKAGKDAE